MLPRVDSASQTLSLERASWGQTGLPQQGWHLQLVAGAYGRSSVTNGHEATEVPSTVLNAAVREGHQSSPTPAPLTPSPSNLHPPTPAIYSPSVLLSSLCFLNELVSLTGVDKGSSPETMGQRQNPMATLPPGPLYSQCAFTPRPPRQTAPSPGSFTWMSDTTSHPAAQKTGSTPPSPSSSPPPPTSNQRLIKS